MVMLELARMSLCCVKKVEITVKNFANSQAHVFFVLDRIASHSISTLALAISFAP